MTARKSPTPPSRGTGRRGGRRGAPPAAGGRTSTTASATRNPHRTSRWWLNVSSMPPPTLPQGPDGSGLYMMTRLAGPVQPVARVAEPGHDEPALVEAAVERRDADTDVRVRRVDPCDPLGRGTERAPAHPA